MSQILRFLVFLSLLAASPSTAQTTLLIARTNVYVDSAGQPTSGDSTTLSYNNQHKPIEYKNWKVATDGSWELRSRLTDYIYDAEGRALYFLIQLGNDVDGWTDRERYTYTYDANGNELSQHFEKWNGTSWVTQWLSMTTWVFNPNGQVLSKTGTSSKYLYTYNAQNLLESETYQVLDNGNWLNYERYDYAYGAAGSNPDSKTTYAWANNAWGESYRSLYVYDAEGNNTQERVEYWVSNAWTNGVNFTYTYDADNNLTYWLWQNWEDEAWTDIFQQFNTYDAESHWLGSQFESWDGTAWSIISIGHNYYSEFVSTSTPFNADFQVSPNPASTAVLLRGEGLSQAQIIDMQGHLVLSQTLGGQSQASLEIGHLPAGAYFLQVRDKDGQVGIKPLQIRH